MGSRVTAHTGACLAAPSIQSQLPRQPPKGQAGVAPSLTVLRTPGGARLLLVISSEGCGAFSPETLSVATEEGWDLFKDRTRQSVL